MSLKQSITVMAKFTNKFHTGYGKTPGRFIVKYISRNDATENLNPIDVALNRQVNSSVRRFSNLNSITNMAIDEYQPAQQLTNELHQFDALQGRSFGSLGLSYDKAQLMSQADLVQSLYNQGHSVEKLVLSFKTDYARQMGILPAQFQHGFRGDFRGHVDQLKLRTAINHGMSQMAVKAHYQNPIWLGAIQVDTNHLHAHMVLTDQVPFYKSHRLGFYYGHREERGKLTDLERQSCREGIQDSLLSFKSMHHFHTQTDLETDVKEQSVETLLQNQFQSNIQIQLIIASLPQNRKLWDADNDDDVMKRPNQLMDNYLNSLIDNYDNQLGYSATLNDIRQNIARTLPDNPNQAYQQQVHKMRQSMKNKIYQQLNLTLSQNPQLLSTASEFLIQSAHDPRVLQFQIQQAFRQQQAQSHSSDMMFFTYRLSSYRQRLQEHHQLGHEFHSLRHQFDTNVAQQSNINRDAFKLRQYYQTESYFHDMATDKYRYFFKVDGHNDDNIIRQTKPELDKLVIQRQQLVQQGQRDGMWAINPATGDTWQNFRVQHGNLVLLDPRCGDVLRQPLAHPDGDLLLIGDTLNHAIQHPEYTLPSDVVKTLNQLGTVYPEYFNLGSDLGPATQKPYASPSYSFTALWAHYARSLDLVTTQLFEDGVIPANEEVDNLNLINSLNANTLISVGPNGLPPVPNPRPRNQFLTPQYFDSIKGIDLEDLGFDFSPTQNRDVAKHVVHQYSLITNRRQQGLDGALYFLKTTNNPIDQNFKKLQSQLNDHRQLIQIIQSTHQLPLGIVNQTDNDISFDQQRQFKSINLRNANSETRLQLSLMQDVTHDIRTAIVSSQNESPTQHHSDESHQL